MALSEDEIRQILKLLEDSSFDFMQLEVEDLKLTVSKSGYIPVTPNENTAPISQGAKASEAPLAGTKEAPVLHAGGNKNDLAQTDVETARARGLIAIKASIVGTVYTTPEPGAPPFVDVGGQVDEDTTVGLIEVMKVFTAVKSGIRGTVAEILVQNGQFVEYGQTLFLVKPVVSRKKG